MSEMKNQYKKKDEELFAEVEKLKNNTSSDFNRLYELSEKYIYKIIYDIVKDRFTTEDLMQETYVQIYNKINTLRESQTFYVWAGRIATNLTLRYIQKNRHEVLAEADADGSTDFVFETVQDDTENFIPEAILMDREKQRILADIIDNLSVEQKLCVQYFYYEEMSVKEIAQAFGCSEGTIKSRLNYARKSIKDAVIEMDVKYDTKLYSLAAMPLFFIVFRNVLEGAVILGAAGAGAASAVGGTAVAGGTAVSTGTAAVTGAGGAATATGVGGAAAVTGTGGATAGGTAAASASAKAAGGIMAKILGTAAGKAAVGVVAAVVVTGGGYGAYQAVKTSQAYDILKETYALEEAWDKAGEETDYVKLEEMYQQMIDLGSAEGYYRIGTIYAADESGKQDYDKAYEYYQQAADAGNANGYYGIAGLYYYGNHFEKDADKAKEYYEKAVEMGSAYAAGKLASSYNNGSEGFEESDDEAAKYYIKAINLSEKGKVPVENSSYRSYLHNAGHKYAEGKGVEQDTAYGLGLMKKAMDLGDSNICLADYYLVKYDDIGIELNEELGIESAIAAAENGNAEGYNLLGLYFDGSLGGDDLEKAVEYFEKAIAMNDKNSVYYYNEAFAYKRLEDYSKAIEYLQKAGELGSDEAINNQIGLCYKGMGDNDKALAYYLKSIELGENANGGNYWNAAVRYQIDQKEYEIAIEYFRKAGELGSKQPVNNRMGVCYGKLGDEDKALEYYLKSVELGEETDPSGLNYANVADKYMDREDYEKAIEYYQGALEHGYTKNANNQIGICYSKMDNQDKALEYYLKSVDSGEEIEGWNYYNAAKQYKDNQEDYEKAIEYYQGALEHGYTQNANNQIGICYNKMGNPDKALEYYLKSIESGEEIEGWNYYNAANQYKDNQEDYEKAIEYYQGALEHGYTKDAYNQIGLCYDEMGNLDKALEYFLKSIDSGEELRGANYENAGLTYDEKKEYKKAIECFQTVMAMGDDADRETYADSAYKLMAYYGNGYGVKTDYAKAMEYYRIAEENGCTYDNLQEWGELLKEKVK